MNTPSHVTAALAETGKAILISQNLEKLIVELLEFRKLHQDFDYAIKTQGVVAQELYKTALMNGVKRLREQKALHPSLDAALVTYIEDRHILVHRWALTHGFPEYSDRQAWHALESHAKSTLAQATHLFGFFTKYLAEYAMPEVAAKDYPTYQARMLNMFNREYAYP
jgi:hypothetical protein